jgi:wyosine [tRNA(Phe)-imidazoG37] synthetase (radical SAM superfamily)
MKLNQPYAGLSLEKIISNIKKFKGSQVIQTLFIRGQYNGNFIDNTTDAEINAWLDAIRDISPRYVMIYPIARDTPAAALEKIPKHTLDEIAIRVRQAGIEVISYD